MKQIPLKEHLENRLRELKEERRQLKQQKTAQHQRNAEHFSYFRGACKTWLS